MSNHKEQILPVINNCRASPNFVKHIEGNNNNYTQSSNITQAQIVTAFSLSFLSPFYIMWLIKMIIVLQFIGQQKA